MVKFKFDLMPSTFWRFLINFMKIGYQRKDYKVVTWNCFTQRYNGNSRLHNYNRNSRVHNALLKIPPPWLQQTSTCIISMKIVTHIFVAKTFTCINVAEISNCVIATDVGTCVIAIESVSCIVFDFCCRLLVIIKIFIEWVTTKFKAK